MEVGDGRSCDVPRVRVVDTGGHPAHRACHKQRASLRAPVPVLDKKRQPLAVEDVVGVQVQVVIGTHDQLETVIYLHLVSPPVVPQRYVVLLRAHRVHAHQGLLLSSSISLEGDARRLGDGHAHQLAVPGHEVDTLAQLPLTGGGRVAVHALAEGYVALLYVLYGHVPQYCWFTGLSCSTDCAPSPCAGGCWPPGLMARMADSSCLRTELLAGR